MSEEIQDSAEGGAVSEEQAAWDEFEALDNSPSEDREVITEELTEAPVDAEEIQQSTEESEESDSTDEQEPDIWANASTELREAYERERNDFQLRDKRLRGQVSALQRQINELKAQSSVPPEQQAKQSDNTALNGFKDDYPELNPLANELQGQNQEIAQLKQALSTLQQERQQLQVSEQIEVLASEHPDWEQTIAKEEFMEWLSNEPRHVQEAAYRNGQEIVDAREAADVVARFKATLSPQQPSGGNAQPKQTLDSKRQRQLETATTAKSKGPSAGYGMPDNASEDALWNQWEEYDKRNGSNY